MKNTSWHQLVTYLNELDFSSSNQFMDMLKQWLSDANVSNEAKINFIKEDIFHQRYTIRDDLIAQKMLEPALLEAVETL